MAKSYTFEVTLRSAYQARGFIMSSFKLYQQNPNMRRHEVTCELRQLDGHIDQLVSAFDGTLHEVREGDEGGEHVVEVVVRMAGDARKPPGFNRWDEARQHHFPRPTATIEG